MSALTVLGRPEGVARAEREGSGMGWDSSWGGVLEADPGCGDWQSTELTLGIVYNDKTAKHRHWGGTRAQLLERRTRGSGLWEGTQG